MSLKMSDHLNFSLQGKVVKCHMHLASQKHGIYDTNSIIIHDIKKKYQFVEKYM